MEAISVVEGVREEDEEDGVDEVDEVVLTTSLRDLALKVQDWQIRKSKLFGVHISLCDANS